MTGETRFSPALAPVAALQDRRITFVLSTLEMGGAERQALLLASALAHRHGAHVEVWGLRGGEAVARRCDELGLPWRAFSPPQNGGRVLRPTVLLKLALALRQMRSEAVLGYTHHANVACGLVCKLAGVRQFVWGQRDSGIVRTRRLAEKLALRGATCFVANSQAGADFLAEELHVPRDKIQIIANGIALDAPLIDRQAWRRQLQLAPDRTVVCMLGTLSCLKDHTTLLHAWRLVLDRLGNAQQQPCLVLAGRWDDRHLEVKRLVDALDLGPAVRLVGHVKDVAGLLQACDLAVLSSRAEGLPNGILEPMASGLAVVATDIPGTRTAIGSHNLQWLAPVGDPAAMADRIYQLLRAPDLRQALGRAHRVFVTRTFSTDLFVERYGALLAAGLAAPGSAAPTPYTT